MPYDVPTAWQLKDRFAPKFDTVADGRITAAIVEAAGEVALTWREADYQPGILFLAAHILTLDGVISPTTSAASVEKGSVTIGETTYETAGGLSSVKVGDVDVKFGGGSSGSTASTSSAISRGGFDATIYGQRYAELLWRNTPRTGPVVRG